MMRAAVRMLLLVMSSDGFCIFVAALTVAPALHAQSAQTRPETGAERTARMDALREAARRHIAQDRTIYSPSEVDDIEARYRSAHRQDPPQLPRSDAAPILQDLVAAYPKSQRSGCAVLQLARMVPSTERERYLRRAITSHGDAWCESGVQVGALARALLAVELAGAGKFDDAERLATEVATMFPGAIDDSGAPLERLLEGIRLLKEDARPSR
jgi:hypothetical protein